MIIEGLMHQEDTMIIKTYMFLTRDSQRHETTTARTEERIDQQ